MSATELRARAAAHFVAWVESGDVDRLRACWADEAAARELEVPS